MSDQKQTEPVARVGAEELEIAFEGPAVFVNKFYLTAVGPNVRIAFAEQPKDGTPVFRAAVVVTAGDLLQLGNLISHLARSMRSVKIEPPSGMTNA